MITILQQQLQVPFLLDIINAKLVKTRCMYYTAALKPVTKTKKIFGKNFSIDIY